MAEIWTRGVEIETKHTLMMMAGALGVSLNTLCVWLFEEAAQPHEELRKTLLERAEEVQATKERKLVLPFDDVPRPESSTRPIGKSRE